MEVGPYCKVHSKEISTVMDLAYLFTELFPFPWECGFGHLVEVDEIGVCSWK